MATIKDIAKRANVSICTVSNVINNKKSVKPETRERIMAAIEEYHFRPKAVARSLKTRQSLMLGIMLPNITNLFFTEMTRGIEDAANQAGYQVVLCNTDEDPNKEKEYLSALYSKDVDGIIFIGSPAGKKLLHQNIDTPIVSINGWKDDAVSSVTIDDFKGGYLAARHLLERRNTDLVFLTGSFSKQGFAGRRDGCLRALAEQGRGQDALQVQFCDVSFVGGYEKTKELLQAGRKLEAIFAVSDVIALGAIRALVEAGLRVPQDVCVVGYDDIVLASMFIPSLSTIRQPKYVMGQTAVKLIFQKINDRTAKSEHVVVEPELVVRESS